VTSNNTPDPLTDQHLDEIETRAAHLYEYGDPTDTRTAGWEELARTDVPALIAEVRRLRVTEAAATTVRALHKRRTERHGSGCVQCGIVWPCPTYLGLAPVGEHHVTEATR
jgi:hypothetical protein